MMACPLCNLYNSNKIVYMNVNACQSVSHFCPTMAATFLEQMHCAVFLPWEPASFRQINTDSQTIAPNVEFTFFSQGTGQWLELCCEEMC